jgi:hypothetical protein
MSSLIVTYDLVGTDAKSDNYDKLIKHIKNKKIYENWARIQLSTWIIVTSKKPETVRDELESYTHPKDRLFVARLTGVAAWHNAKCKNEWLTENL